MKAHDSDARATKNKYRATKLARAARFFAGLAVICCLAIDFGASAPSRRNTLALTHNSAPQTEPEIAAANSAIPARTRINTAQEREKPGVEVITISGDGFEPAAMTRRKGMVCLVIANEDSYEETALALDRVAGGRLREIDIRRSQPRWGEWFDLHPGQYLLSDRLHSERVCHITVTAQ